MPSICPLLKLPRVNLNAKSKAAALCENMFEPGIYVQVMTRAPQRRNSAPRTVAKVHLTNRIESLATFQMKAITQRSRILYSHAGFTFSIHRAYVIILCEVLCLAQGMQNVAEIVQSISLAIQTMIVKANRGKVTPCRKRAERREFAKDPSLHSALIGQLITGIMQRAKRSMASPIAHGAIDTATEDLSKRRGGNIISSDLRKYSSEGRHEGSSRTPCSFSHACRNSRYT
jgi:hypothetical protein